MRPSPPHHVPALVVLLSLPTAAFAANDTVATTASTSSSCLIDRQLAAGAAHCSPVCDTTSTAACLAYSVNTDVCRSTAVTTGCPLQTSNQCVFQCFRWTPSTSNDALTFYIVSPNDDMRQWNSGDLRQSQRYVNSIGAIDVPERINYVSLIGRSATSDMSIGGALSVQVDLSFSGSNVTNLTLAHLDMAIYRLPSIRISQSPPRLQSLTMTSCKLTTLPIDTSGLTALTTMDLAHNDLVTFSKNHSMESLVHLNLANNSLTTFEATFPALQTLDLSHNDLAAIPDNIYLFSKLKSLDLSGNPLVGKTFTWTQYWFLTNLTTLSLSRFTDFKCTPENQQLLKAQVVCVMDSADLIVLSKTSLTWYIVIPIVGTAIVSIALFSLWYNRRKKHHAKRNHIHRVSTKTATGHLTQGEDGDEFFRMSDVVSPSQEKHAPVKHTKARLSASGSLWADEDLLACQLRFEDIEDVRQIGVGAFAVVWLVTYRESRLLASKRLLRDHVNHKNTQEFVTEIKLNAQLDHPSIVHFVGAAWTVESDLQALFEYMTSGDLRGYLDATRHDVQHNHWTPLKIQMAIEITEALVYVHSFTPPLVHRDLKSKNVLLDENMKAKVSDFGVSRFASENGTMTAGVGTGKWLAPEVLAGGHDYDHTCDIYSFGVVLAELDTHTLPYEELHQADVATLQLVLAGTVRPRFRHQCPPVIRELANKCLAFDPKDRPSAMEIAFTLRIFAKEYQETV